MLSIGGGPNQYKDADGHFSLSLWQSRVNRFEGIDFSAYIADGTVMGHYLVDEPNDPTNWNGVPIPGETVEAMAQYSKELLAGPADRRARWSLRISPRPESRITISMPPGPST